MNHIHIFCPPSYYLGQVRGVGCQKWRTVTRKVRTDTSAMSKAVSRMTEHDKRARVLLCSTNPWLEPLVVMECSR